MELPGVVDDVQDLKVLVVDDQINMRRTVKNMIEISWVSRIFWMPRTVMWP